MRSIPGQLRTWDGGAKCRLKPDICETKQAEALLERASQPEFNLFQQGFVYQPPNSFGGSEVRYCPKVDTLRC